jgi:hypothetical protein
VSDFKPLTAIRGQADEVGAAVGGGAAVQNIADNSSLPRNSADVRTPAYRDRFRLLDWLRRNSVRPRQRLCMAAAYGDTVKIVSSKEREFAYTGLQTCGSITCPNCGPRIGAFRRDEITMGLDSWVRGHGGRILFGTLTLRHNRSQSHAELADAISKCWGRATGGKGWVDDRRSHGIVHTIRVWETKFNDENGWHVHVHFLLLVEHGRSDSDALIASMFRRWRRAALSLGLGAPLLRQGTDLHEVTGDEAAEQLGGYLAKESVQRGRASAEAMGWELTNTDGKFRGESLGPIELLKLAAAGVEGYRAIWNEYEASMKKRRSIAWSKGARADLGLDIELTDEEIAEKAELEAILEHVVMPARVYRRIARTAGMRAELLDVVREFGGVTAVLWLRARGFNVYDDEPGGDDE